MKTYIYLFIFLFPLSFGGQVFAEECQETCKIQDGPAVALEDYINNLDLIIKNTATAVKGKTKVGNTKKIQGEILAQMSKIISFSSYYSSFDYYVAVPITNEVPQEVKRDHDLLVSQTERLVKLLERSIRSGYAEVEISSETLCEGVENCKNLKGNVRGILTTLIVNNKKIIDFYRFSIIDQRNYGETEFYLVSDTFEGEIAASYNKDTLTSCSLCDGGFFDSVKKSINTISQNSGKNNEGIRKWKEAWALLTGTVGQSNYTKEEERIFRDGIGAQGLDVSAADTVSDNLKRYNSGGISTSNPLFNSANYTQSKAKQDTQVFANSLEEFLNTGEASISIIALQKSLRKVKTSSDIQSELSTLLGDQAIFSSVQDTGSEKIIGKLIRMHYSLVRSINILDKNVKVAEEVCNSQGQGKGNCDNYD